MKQLLEFIIKGITAKPEEVVISESEEEGSLILKLKVSDDDFGTIIGKGGRTVKALRDVLRLRAQKENIKYNLIIEEPEKPL